jgi:hypothetical protein
VHGETVDTTVEVVRFVRMHVKEPEPISAFVNVNVSAAEALGFTFGFAVNTGAG